MLGALLFFAVMVWYKFWGEKDFVATPLPLLVVVSFLVGCLSILMGLLAEITMRTYYEASQTATYVVRDICRGGQVGESPAAPPAGPSA